MLSCKEATELLSKQLETELSIYQKMNLGMHKLMCSGCRNFDKQISTLSQLSKAYQPIETPETENKL